MTSCIRRAREADIPRMVELAGQRRHGDGRQRSDYARDLAKQLAGECAFALVSSRGGAVDGYAIGQLMATPPVYDPGGETCIVEDIAVAAPRDWPTVGAALLQEVYSAARARGAVLAIVVCDRHDEPKQRMVGSTGAGVVSEWWVKDLRSPACPRVVGATSENREEVTDQGPLATAQVRRAGAADIPRLVELAERRFADYARAQPLFWRRAADVAEKYARRLARRLSEDRIIVLVADDGGAVDGYLVGELIPASPTEDPRGETCFVDGFAVAESGGWADIGVALLREVESEARTREVARLMVVCGRHDEPKRRLLAAVGAAVESEWWVRSL